ncbi:MAG: hypothetical protein IJD88_07005, partial [Clostridia bacterium]|nr:hypothetical protein [Clostridia bacterium]
FFMRGFGHAFFNSGRVAPCCCDTIKKLLREILSAVLILRGGWKLLTSLLLSFISVSDVWYLLFCCVLVYN